MELTPGQRALADEIAAILAAGRDGPDVRAMVRAGRASGLLAPRELAVLERRSRPPAWMLEALGLAADFAPSTSFTCVRASTGRLWRLAPPTVLQATAPPATFEAQEERSPDVDVISGEGAELVLNNRAKACFLADGYVPGLTDEDNLWAWPLMARRPARSLPGRSLILFVEGSKLLPHWLLDTLPRLGALAAVGRTLADYDQVVLAAASSPFHAQSLEALGIPRERVVTRAEAGSRFSSDAFDFVTPVRSGYVADPWVYDFVTSLFDAPAAPPFRKLFISRQNARRRRILDEASLHPLLEARGYQIVNAEDHALGEMARLCGQAAAIAGPHGAGIANAVFAGPGTRVLEIFGAHLSSEYWRLSSQRGFAYACLQARDEAGRDFDAQELAGHGVMERKEAGMSLSAEELAGALDDLERL